MDSSDSANPLLPLDFAAMPASSALPMQPGGLFVNWYGVGAYPGHQPTYAHDADAGDAKAVPDGSYADDAPSVYAGQLDTSPVDYASATMAPVDIKAPELALGPDAAFAALPPDALDMHASLAGINHDLSHAYSRLASFADDAASLMVPVHAAGSPPGAPDAAAAPLPNPMVSAVHHVPHVPHVSAPYHVAPAAASQPAACHSLSSSVNSQFSAINGVPPFHMADFHHELSSFGPPTQQDLAAASIGGSPQDNWLEVRSLSSSDNGWSNVDLAHRPAFDLASDANAALPLFTTPGAALHIRTGSHSSHQSDVPRSAQSFSSFDDLQFPLASPPSDAENLLSHHLAYVSPHQSASPPNHAVTPAQPPPPPPPPDALPSCTRPSPAKQSPTSGSGRPAKTAPKKASAAAAADGTEKRIGKRKGPLRPDQRQSAHEIRKVRACIRCKFLKKTCDKGVPCSGCKPSHARLWQVPCTRIDIKDIAYFMKDWKADFERHVSLGFSVGNVKGFSSKERQIYITHGYGFFLPISAREVYVRDDKCFGVDWVESLHETPRTFEVNTAKLSAGMDGVSSHMLHEYLDCHIDRGFDDFVDEYFEGTLFVTEMLKTAYRMYRREKIGVLRKALKLVVAYNLTLHVTMVHGLDEDEAGLGRVEDPTSRFYGKTVAPVMINFQIKCALADMWRELQKEVLEELSALYSSVYSGERLKNWPVIFILACVMLIIWELMQFDCHYRSPDATTAEKFCGEMEGVPVGVMVGLFSAISQKLPTLTEWDSRQHHQLLGSNVAVCDALTEVRGHIAKYEAYLKSRHDAKFDRADFDSLSNKFLSKLVFRGA